MVDIKSATIRMGTLEVQEWLIARAKATIANALTGILGERVSIEFSVLDVSSL